MSDASDRDVSPDLSGKASEIPDEGRRPDGGRSAQAPDSAPETGSGAESENSRTPEKSGERGGARIGRRHLFAGAAGTAVAGAVLGAGGGYAVARAQGAPEVSQEGVDQVDLGGQVPFYDQAHPAGIQTEPQRYAVYMTFDLASTATSDDLRALLARWTAAIGQMVQGRPIGVVEPDRADAVGSDTGEAEGLAPASLTVTVGLGPGVFDDRFGLESKRPKLLAALPRLPGDSLDPDQTGGDLSVQACADDPQVAYHAVRNLARMVTSTAQTRWVVLGFGRASAGPHQQTPRNLFGFKDGTRNVTTAAEFDKFVWLQDADWMTGGTYQVARKIRMHIENWDADRVSDQQQVFGRTKASGAPLSGGEEMTTPDFQAKDKAGDPLVPVRSHVALAAHENNSGIKILRRSYNYTDGLNAQGLLDAGLLFLSYQNDPKHFIDIQSKLGRFDLMNEYVQHIGSAIFAVPPAPKTGGYIGQALFE